MYYDKEVSVLLNFVANQPGKGTPKHVRIIFSEVPVEIRHIDIGHLIESCVEKYGYLKRLPAFMSDSATVWLTKKGIAFVSKQKRSR